MIFVAVVLAILAAFGWFFGTIQGLLRIALGTPLPLLLALIWIGASIATIQRRRSGRTGIRPQVHAIALGLLLVLLDTIAYPIRMTNWAARYESSLARTTVAPESEFLPRRVLPMEVADQFARGAQTDAQFVYGEIHPTLGTAPLNRGRLVWQAASRPNSFIGTWTSGLRSIVEVDADTTKPEVHVYQMDLPVGGEGNINDFALVIHRSIDPLSEVLPPVYDVGARQAIVPLVRTIWGIPRYEGVVVFDAAGNTTKLDWHAAAARYPHLRLYPESLVRWQADAWGSWRSGVMGYFNKRGVLELANIGDNPPPTLLDDPHHAWWVVPMEPVGKSFGLAGLLFVDPSSGNGVFWNTASQNVMSPSLAIGVAEGDPRIAQLKDAAALEPILAIIHGQVNWLVPIAPSSRSQVQSLALVNAHDRSTVVAPTFAQVFAPPSQDACGIVGSGKGGGSAVQPSVGALGTATMSYDQRIAITQRLVTELQAQLDTLRRAVH